VAWGAGYNAHAADSPSKMTNQCLTVRAHRTNFPFLVRRQICFIPRTTGEFRLSMNDRPGTHGNNSGSLKVQVTTWPAAAIPARVELGPQHCPSQ
jgi:hypothetical protein